MTAERTFQRLVAQLDYPMVHRDGDGGRRAGRRPDHRAEPIEPGHEA